MNLKQIYQPISNELSQVEIELKKQINSIAFQRSPFNAHRIINHFFKVPGKRLRPALVLLSAKSVNCGLSTVDSGLIRLAVAVEFIHSASLIHDDIVDNSESRRNQITLNKKFGNQIAVLTGDIIFSQAFSLLTKIGRNDILDIMCQTTQKMCFGEVSELQITNHKLLTTDYLKIIENKTASLMSACCECAAILVCPEDKKNISALKEYGFNFGMAYQLIDDYLDSDISIDSELNLVEKAKEYAECAKESIKFLADSEYKKSLENLLDFITNVQNEAYSFNSR
jgi:geranylgeranyl pyrophosphate synthase